jgi:ribosomal protein S17E
MISWASYSPFFSAIKSKIYEGRLAGYVTMFDNHKKEIGFALKVHTALGVDAANKKLDGQDVHLKLIEDKMEALFRKLDTPRERDVQKFIDEKGGAKACVDNEATLQELVSKSGESLASLDPTNSGNGDLTSARKLLNKELAEDVDEAFKKNMKLFDRKLEMQSRQLTDAISSTGEYIISVLSGGAHDKILDPVCGL